MALNFADRSAVRLVIVPRCTAAVASYASYLLAGTPTTPQLAWAREAIRNPGFVGEQVSWHVIPSQAFIDAGSGISDGDLDYLVQTAINAHFIGV